jgi:hypothetical protein
VACCGHSVGIIGHIVGAGHMDGRNGQIVVICGHWVSWLGHCVCWIGHCVGGVPSGQEVMVPGLIVG